MKAISEALPSDDARGPCFRTRSPTTCAYMLMASKRIEVDSIDCEHFTKLEDWYADVKDKWLEGQPEAAGQAVAQPRPPADPPGPGLAGPPAGVPAAADSGGARGPTGEGWVIQIRRASLSQRSVEGAGGAAIVRKTLLKNLETGSVMLLGADGKTPVSVTLKDLGIAYPVLIKGSRPDDEEIPMPGAEHDNGPAGAAANEKAVAVPALRLVSLFSSCGKKRPSTTG